MAYDGYNLFLIKRRGNYIVNSEKDVQNAFDSFNGLPLYVEKWVSFKKELAVMVAKGKHGIASYPCVETIQKDSVCHLVIAPAQIDGT